MEQDYDSDFPWFPMMFFVDIQVNMGGAPRKLYMEGYFFWHFFFCPGSWWLRGFCGFYGPGSQWLLVAPGGSGGSWWLLWLPWLLYSYGSSIIYRSTYQGSMFTRCILRIRYTSIYFYLYLYLYLYLYVYLYLYLYLYTSSTAQGGGGSFKNRKPIGEIGCCESGMAERIH